MSYTQKIALGVLFVAVLAAGMFAYRSRSPATAHNSPVVQLPGRGVVGNAASSSDPYDVLVTYTEKGFSPRDITITHGQRVRFLNNSTLEFWPASGIHPTHTLYPEKESTDCLGSSFDACAALKKGEFFDFTFNYVGDWPVHDHLHGYNSGSIMVTD